MAFTHFLPNTDSTLKFSLGLEDRFYSHRLEQRVKYLNLHQLLMLDYDPGEVINNHYTVKSKEEALSLLPTTERWRVYETPSGGLHCFLMSRYLPLPEMKEEAYRMMTELKCDRLYRDLTLRRGAYGVRVGPKPGRFGDYVARFLCELGEGVSLPDNQEVIRYHDTFLR